VAPVFWMATFVKCMTGRGMEGHRREREVGEKRQNRKKVGRDRDREIKKEMREKSREQERENSRELARIQEKGETRERKERKTQHTARNTYNYSPC